MTKLKCGKLQSHVLYESLRGNPDLYGNHITHLFTQMPTNISLTFLPSLLPLPSQIRHTVRLKFSRNCACDSVDNLSTCGTNRTFNKLRDSINAHNSQDYARLASPLNNNWKISCGLYSSDVNYPN